MIQNLPTLAKQSHKSIHSISHKPIPSIYNSQPTNTLFTPSQQPNTHPTYQQYSTQLPTLSLKQQTITNPSTINPISNTLEEFYIWQQSNKSHTKTTLPIVQCQLKASQSNYIDTQRTVKNIQRYRNIQNQHRNISKEKQAYQYTMGSKEQDTTKQSSPKSIYQSDLTNDQLKRQGYFQSAVAKKKKNYLKEQFESAQGKKSRSIYKSELLMKKYNYKTYLPTDSYHRGTIDEQIDQLFEDSTLNVSKNIQKHSAINFYSPNQDNITNKVTVQQNQNKNTNNNSIQTIKQNNNNIKNSNQNFKLFLIVITFSILLLILQIIK